MLLVVGGLFNLAAFADGATAFAMGLGRLSAAVDKNLEEGGVGFAIFLAAPSAVATLMMGFLDNTWLL